MDPAAKGFLQAPPLLERIRVDNELDGFFCDLTDALEDARHSLYDLQCLLDRTLLGAGR